MKQTENLQYYQKHRKAVLFCGQQFITNS